MKRPFRWKTLSSGYVYNDRWFKARADSCELPDGRIIEPYYVVELPDWTNIIVVTKEERVVLVLQYRYPVDEVTYELPGGIIDKGETPEAAARREMLEETGYTSDNIEFLFKISPNTALNNNTAYFFLATGAEQNGKQKFDEFEDIDVVTLSKEEAMQLLKEDKMQHGVQIGAVYKAFLRLGWLQSNL